MVTHIVLMLCQHVHRQTHPRASKQEAPVLIAPFDIPLSLHDLQSSLMLSLQDVLLTSLLLLKGLECSLPLVLLALYARLMSPVHQWPWVNAA